MTMRQDRSGDNCNQRAQENNARCMLCISVFVCGIFHAQEDEEYRTSSYYIEHTNLSSPFSCVLLKPSSNIPSIGLVHPSCTVLHASCLFSSESRVCEHMSQTLQHGIDIEEPICSCVIHARLTSARRGTQHRGCHKDSATAASP